MKITDFAKKERLIFEPKNPKVIQNSKTKYYEIEYDAVYADGRIKKHTGFGSYKNVRKAHSFRCGMDSTNKGFDTSLMLSLMGTKVSLAVKVL